MTIFLRSDPESSRRLGEETDNTPTDEKETV